MVTFERSETEEHRPTAGRTLVGEAARKLRDDLAKSRPFSAGTIIAWQSIAHTGVSYEYAAIYAGGKWYTTIENDNKYIKRAMSHDELLAYFADRGDHLANLRVATDFEGVSL